MVSLISVEDAVIGGGGGGLPLARAAADATATVGSTVSGDHTTFNILWVSTMLLVEQHWKPRFAEFEAIIPVEIIEVLRGRR